MVVGARAPAGMQRETNPGESAFTFALEAVEDRLRPRTA